MRNALLKCILFDWGDTVMRDFPQYHGPMHLWPQVEALPGVADAISAIHSGRVIALASNAADSGEEEIRKALALADLDRHFDKIYCFCSIGHLKPSAGFFNHILNDLSLAPENVIMIGDDFERDVLGANRVEIYAIWYNRQSSEIRQGPMYDTIHSFAELPDMIKAHEKILAE